MIIVYIFIAIAEIAIALACLYIACISIAFVLHNFCNMIMLVAKTTAHGIMHIIIPKMGRNTT